MASPGKAALDDSVFAEIVEREMVQELRPALTSREFLRFATKGPSTVASFPLWGDPGAATAPQDDLTEVTSTVLSDTEVSATAAEVGFRVDVTDVIRETTPGNLVSDVAGIVARSVAEKLETERARSEAASRKLKIDFHTADMRSLQKTFDAKFDLVIACDNAVPDLLSDDEILQAFREFYRVTTEAGGCIISVRDYDTLEKGGRRLYPRMVHDIPGGRVVIFDCWDFDGEVYDITMYVVEDTGLATAHTRVIRGGRYYCVSIIKLEELMQKAGFVRVDTLLERYFQPLQVGLKE